MSRGLIALRAFLLLGACSGTYLYLADTPDVPRDEIGPTAMIVWGLLYLALRAPYRRFSWLELPLASCFLLSTAVGTLWFKDEGGFSIFMCAYASLAWSYGYFCTCLDPQDPLRESVVEPTKKTLHLGLPGVEIGLLLAPFVWPYFWWRSRGS